MELSDIRLKYSLSIPSGPALAAIKEVGPVVELGAGTGFWAHTLRQAGVDVEAFDLGGWMSRFNPEKGLEEGSMLMHSTRFGKVIEGGPDSARKHTDRALLLVWPDYSGVGFFGRACLQGYHGNTLIVVGEWEGCTHGAIRDGMGVHGQSFSPEFQAEVDREFELVKSVPLLNWPTCADLVQIFRRR